MKTTAQETEILIVGAGAAGALLAAKLAASGRKVLVLEAGAPWRNDDLVSSQLWARRLKGSDQTVSAGQHTVSPVYNSGAGFGGAALHYFAGSLRLHPEDFKVRSLYGRAVDWPIEYDDLRPYYDKVQREIGISGDAAAEPWRPEGEPYPMPPMASLTQGEVVARGFAKHGLAVSPMAAAINSVEYNGRPACTYDGWCEAGCPIGALAQPLFTYFPPALKAGVEFRPFSTVVRVNTDASGRKATGVTYADRRGERHEVRAKLVILAAYALQTPRLLLASASDTHPNGLANGSDAVGRYLMSCPMGPTYGLFEEETQPYMGVNCGSMMSQAEYRGKERDGYFGSTTWLIGQSLKPNDLVSMATTRPELFGEELQAFLTRASQHLGALLLLGEDQPDPENRVTLGAARDALGVPIARAQHNFGPDPLAFFKAQMPKGLAIMKDAGAQEAWSGRLLTLSAYGTTRMGDDPKTSVTNSYGQTHEVDNLFIAGSSLFPTTGAAAPTFTLNALAWRTSDHIIANWSAFS